MARGLDRGVGNQFQLFDPGNVDCGDDGGAFGGGEQDAFAAATADKEAVYAAGDVKFNEYSNAWACNL